MFPSTLDRFKDKIAPIVLNEEEKLRLNYVIMNQSMYDAGLPFIPDNQDSDSGVLQLHQYFKPSCLSVLASAYGVCHTFSLYYVHSSRCLIRHWRSCDS